MFIKKAKPPDHAGIWILFYRTKTGKVQINAYSSYTAAKKAFNAVKSQRWIFLDDSASQPGGTYWCYWGADKIVSKEELKKV